MRSIPGDCGVPEVDPTIVHGLPNYYRSIFQGGLIERASMIAKKDRHASYSLDNSLPGVSDILTSVSKMASYKHSNRADLDTIYIFDRWIAQDRGLEFYHTGKITIILHNT